MALRKEVAATCLEYLQLEMMTFFSSYNKQTHAAQKAPEEGDISFQKMERIGFDVGQKCAEQLCRDKVRFVEPLEVIKFMCKEFWLEAFGKQVDNLKTDHHGLFVLTDSKFKPLLKWSSIFASLSDEEEREALSNPKYLEARKSMLALPLGMIRGGLSAFALTAVVTAEPLSGASCKVTVRLR